MTPNSETDETKSDNSGDLNARPEVMSLQPETMSPSLESLISNQPKYDAKDKNLPAVGEPGDDISESPGQENDAFDILKNGIKR